MHRLLGAAALRPFDLRVLQGPAISVIPHTSEESRITKVTREASMGRRVILTAPMHDWRGLGNNYDHGIMTMIKELPNEENGGRFF